MNEQVAEQLRQLRVEVRGKFIPLYEDADCAVVCLIPAPPAPLEPEFDVWSRASTPVLAYLDGHRARAIVEPGAADIARRIAAGERVECELVAN